MTKWRLGSWVEHALFAVVCIWMTVTYIICADWISDIAYGRHRNNFKCVDGKIFAICAANFNSNGLGLLREKRGGGVGLLVRGRDPPHATCQTPLFQPSLQLMTRHTSKPKPSFKVSAPSSFLSSSFCLLHQNSPRPGDTGCCKAK